uniref:Retrotransposon gag domain-containing protein n=1 Tax=Ananas comosus var. bracteatus TaxID=296719 RepID=A0A6V7P529_ANACO|nr:unnamed protein product [Ananas comosus var. bracteatus]
MSLMSFRDGFKDVMRRGRPPPMVPTPDPAPPLEVPESSVSGEIQDLRDQVAALVGVVRRQAEASQQLAEASQRQEEQMALLRELVSRQAAATPVTQQPPVSPVRAPTGVEAAGAAAPPPMGYTVPPGVAAGTCPAMSSTSTHVDPALEAERDRALACLTAFKKFNPPIFNGESGDPWEMESWVDTMEKLFEDLYTLEQDKVHLAVHCLEKSARVWWKATRQNRSPTLPPMMWEEFRGLLYGVHFPDSDKKKMEEQFRILKQGDRTVRDYKREFSHIVNCVPHVVRSDEDKAGCFERGLRREIYAAMQPLRLKTFTEVFDRALWVEQGIAKMRAERESNDKGADKKRSASGPAGSSKYKKPPKYPRKPGKDRGPPHCYICGEIIGPTTVSGVGSVISVGNLVMDGVSAQCVCHRLRLLLRLRLLRDSSQAIRPRCLLDAPWCRVKPRDLVRRQVDEFMLLKWRSLP